jgi:hypothetical protein
MRPQLFPETVALETRHGFGGFFHKTKDVNGILAARLTSPLPHHNFAPGHVEAAARGRIDRARHIAFEDDALPRRLGVGDRYRRQQRLGIGVLRAGEEVALVGDLDDFAQIPDRGAVAGSSQTMRLGCDAKARAMPMRWR